MGRDEEKDWFAEYMKLTEDPQFAEIREDLAATIESEAPDTKDMYCANEDGYRNFVTNYNRVKKAHFSNINPRTLERARSGDTDGAIDLLKEMGIVGKNGLED